MIVIIGSTNALVSLTGKGSQSGIGTQVAIFQSNMAPIACLAVALAIQSDFIEVKVELLPDGSTSSVTNFVFHMTISGIIKFKIDVCRRSLLCLMCVMYLTPPITHLKLEKFTCVHNVHWWRGGGRAKYNKGANKYMAMPIIYGCVIYIDNFTLWIHLACHLVRRKFYATNRRTSNLIWCSNSTVASVLLKIFIQHLEKRPAERGQERELFSCHIFITS